MAIIKAFLLFIGIINGEYCFRPKVNMLTTNTAFFGEYKYYGILNGYKSYIINDIEGCIYANKAYLRRINNGYWIVSTSYLGNDTSYNIRCNNTELNAPMECKYWDVYGDTIHEIEFSNGKCETLTCNKINVNWVGTLSNKDTYSCAGEMYYHSPNIYLSYNGYVLHYNEKESKWICNKDINAIRGCQFSYYAMQNDIENTWRNIDPNETLRVHFWDPYDLRTYPVDITCIGDINTPTKSPTIATTEYPTQEPTITPSVSTTSLTSSENNSKKINFVLLIAGGVLCLLLLVGYGTYTIIQLKKNKFSPKITGVNTDISNTNDNHLQIEGAGFLYNDVDHVNTIEMEQNDQLMAQELQKNAFDIKHITSGNIKLDDIETKKGIVKSNVQIGNDYVIAKEIQDHQRDIDKITAGNNSTTIH